MQHLKAFISKKNVGSRNTQLRINLINLNVDRKGWWFEHSVSELGVCWSAEDAKNVS